MQTCRYIVPINFSPRPFCKFGRVLQILSIFTVKPRKPMFRKMPAFLLGVIRRIALIVLKEFCCFCDFKIFDVVEVFIWRNIASMHLWSYHLSPRKIACKTTHTSFNCSTRTYSNVVRN